MPLRSRPPSIAITSTRNVRTPSFFNSDTVSPSDYLKSDTREESTLTPSPKDDSSSPKIYDPDTLSGSWDAESTLVRSSQHVSPRDKSPILLQRTPSPNSSANGFEYSLDVRRPLSNTIDTVSTLSVEESLFPTSLPQDIATTNATRFDSSNDSRSDSMLNQSQEWTLETAKMNYGLSPTKTQRIKEQHNFIQTSWRIYSNVIQVILYIIIAVV